MPANKGRAMLLQVDMTGGGSYTTIAGFRENSYSLKGGGVDVTTKDSGGWQERLADAGVKSLSFSGSGVFENDAAVKKVRDYMRAGSINNFKMLFENGETIICRMEVTEVSMTGAYNGEVQYSISLESDGVPSFA